MPNRTRPTFISALGKAALASGLLLGGCAVARPSVEVQGLRSDGEANGVHRLQIDLNLQNSGDDEVQLVEYDYVLSLEDGAKYAGRWAALRALPPDQQITASVPAVIPSASVGGSGFRWSLQGVMRYRDPKSVARILYEAGLLKTEVEFSAEGTGLLPPPPATAPQKTAD